MIPLLQHSRGSFLVVEGPNGAGKTTFIAELAEALRNAGREVVVTREPGGSLFAEGLRTTLKDPARKAGAFATALVFNGARADHADSVITPALERGAVVICDRYYHSTEVFQITLSDELTQEQVDLLQRLHRLFPQPDVTVFILPTPELLAKRLGTVREADRFEGNVRELAAYTEYAHAYSRTHVALTLRPGIGNESLSDDIAMLLRASNLIPTRASRSDNPLMAFSALASLPAASAQRHNTAEIALLQEDDSWGEHALYGREDWKAEVANGDTQLGYWAWVEHRLEAEDDDGDR